MPATGASVSRAGAVNPGHALIKKQLQDDAAGDCNQQIVAAGLHPVVTARRRGQTVAAPVIHYILTVTVLRRQALALVIIMRWARTALAMVLVVRIPAIVVMLVL